MNLNLQKSKLKTRSEVIISGSKSESNRLLILQALYPEITIKNLSNSDDTVLMQEALNSNNKINIHHAGTTMRFLTSFFAIQENVEIELYGSNRMHERPIKVLVDALKTLGANIEYLGKVGFPPLKIKGKKLISSQLTIASNVSSQYISALLLIAPKLVKGLELTLEGEIMSLPYIQMTLSLLKKLDVRVSLNNNVIKVEPLEKLKEPISFFVESDWTSVSYFYSTVALSDIGTEIKLSSFNKNSFQGDSLLYEIYEDFGVESIFRNNNLIISKVENIIESEVRYNLRNTPDLAQTMAVTCLGLGVKCHLDGLETLKIKETDRLIALKAEIEKLGGLVRVTENSLGLSAPKSLKNNISISTYNDHRMAMAFAPLALKTALIIENSDVVSKSYPEFWNDLKSIGIKITQ